LPPIARETAGGIVRLTGFGRPFSVACDPQGRLLVADMDLHGLCRVSPDLGGCQWLMDERGWSAWQPFREGPAPAAAAGAPMLFDGPHSIAVASGGRLFVTTYYTPGVHVVSPDGDVRLLIGGHGDAPRLTGPATGLFDGGGRLLVSEYALHGIFAYDAEGTFLGALGGGENGFRAAPRLSAGHGAAWFDRPHMCRALRDGDLVVADTWNHRLQRFTGDGVFVGSLGDGRDGWREATGPFPASDAPAGFHAPVAVGVADDGRLVVADWGNDRLQWFDAEGRHLATEDDLGLDRPYDAQVFGRRCAIANSHKGSVLIKDI
jgi:hypothetical protein